MSPPAEAAPPLAAASGRLRALLWLAAALAAGALTALGAAPLLLLLLPLLLATGLALLGSDLAFVWLLVASSGLGIGWSEGAAFQVGSNTINVGGIRWGLIFLVAGFVLLRRGGLRLRPGFGPYALFVALAALGILWAPSRFEGLKNCIQYATPLLVGLLAYDLAERESNIEALRAAFWVGLTVSATAAIVPALAGQTLGGSLDPAGRLINRGFGLYLLPLASLALAGARYRDRRYWLAFGIVAALTLITLSRTSIAALVLLVALAGIGRSPRFRLSTLVLAGLLLLLALSFPPLRARLAEAGAQSLAGDVSVSGSGEQARIRAGGLDLSGRGLLWLQTWRHAREAPLLGHGTGSATTYLERTYPGGAVHPHNDYLRVFHDLGLAGLLSVALFALLIPRRLWRRHRDSPQAPVRELSLAAFLAWMAFLAAAVFENDMIYVTTITQNVFVLTGLALGASSLGPTQVPAAAGDDGEARPPAGTGDAAFAGRSR